MHLALKGYTGYRLTSRTAHIVSDAAWLTCRTAAAADASVSTSSVGRRRGRRLKQPLGTNSCATCFTMLTAILIYHLPSALCSSVLLLAAISQVHAAVQLRSTVMWLQVRGLSSCFLQRCSQYHSFRCRANQHSKHAEYKKSGLAAKLRT
jgi:hypothetical protein